jgi:exopolysaccharide biosynthesis polyprenyl glycosylphosphotransferase
MNGEGVPLPLLGASWDLEYVIADRDVEHVIIAFSTAPHDVMLSMVRRCQKLGVTVSHVPRLFEASVERHTIEHLGGLPIVTAHPADPEGWQFIAKHAIDRVVAALALLILSPVLIGLAIATKLSTGGPVLFRQSRVGRDGIEFDMLKFRTMRGSPNRHGESDADWAAEILGTGNGNASHSIPPPPLRRRSLQPGREPEDRRTRLGRFMRRCSLDELPQIWNVARGDMSLVGPRPERIGYVRRFEHKVHRYSDRHRVKSGITGWAQVNGLRGKTSLPDRVEWDNYYIENWSLWLDFKIALLTVGAFFRSTE